MMNDAQTPMALTAERKRFANIRRSLLSTWPFFGHLALRFQVSETKSVETVKADGRTLSYNPEWVRDTPIDQVRAAVARVVLACGLKHHLRRGDRKYKTWQQASQIATERFLVDAGLINKRDAQWYDAQMTVEQAYKMLQAEEEESDPGKDGDKDGDGDGPADPNGKGEIGDGSSDGKDSDDMSEQDWDAALQQAVQHSNSTGSGKVPATVEEMVKGMHVSRVGWRELLRRYMQEPFKTDYTWSMPNRRFIDEGLYLPSLTGVKMGTIVFAIDTSGSMSSEALEKVWSEIRDAANEVQPSSVVVMQCDTSVKKIETFEPSAMPEEMRLIGRGGTRFEPVFEEVAKWNDDPVCLIYLTDLLATFPQPPDYPVIWAAYEPYTGFWNGHDGEGVAPFGETIYVD